jgi:hypothetical protein
LTRRQKIVGQKNKDLPSPGLYFSARNFLPDRYFLSDFAGQSSYWPYLSRFASLSGYWQIPPTAVGGSLKSNLNRGKNSGESPRRQSVDR